MREITLTVKLEGVAHGMFPISCVTEMLYAAIDYLEPRDKDGMDLQSILPINKKFQEGTGASLILEIKETL